MTSIDYQAVRWAVGQIPDPLLHPDDHEPLAEEDLRSVTADIYRVIWWLRGVGITVEPHATWLEDEVPENPAFDTEKYRVSGRCSYEDCWVGINEPDAQRALEVVCHEAGHMMSYRHFDDRYPATEELPYNQEHLAYLYGWCVIRLLGLDNRITKERWRAHHADIFWEIRTAAKGAAP